MRRLLGLCCLFLLALAFTGTSADGEPDFEAYVLPEACCGPCQVQGRVETLTYRTESYAIEEKEGLATGSLYETKTLHVYLPADYDPSGSYDVLYLLHGSGETQEYWFFTQKPVSKYYREQRGITDRNYTMNVTLNVLDHLMSDGRARPFIVVTPTYFSTLREETTYGSGREDTLFYLDAFEQELRNDIIPLIEGSYAVAGTREHRAIAGFSRGSRFTTRVAVPRMLDLFGYIGSFHGWESLEIDQLQAVLDAQPEHPILFWYNGFGPKDYVTQTHAEACAHLSGGGVRGITPGVNYAAVEKPEGQHYYDIAVLDLYNFSQILFRE